MTSTPSPRESPTRGQATAEGRFEREIVPIYVRDEEGQATDELMTTDEGIRPDSTVATLANLKPRSKRTQSDSGTPHRSPTAPRRADHE